MTRNGILSLIRLPNLPAVLGNVVAGSVFAAAAVADHHVGARHWLTAGDLPWLRILLSGLSAVCLYAGGMTLGDLTSDERHGDDRHGTTIRNGLVSRREAGAIYLALTLAGLIIGSLSLFKLPGLPAGSHQPLAVAVLLAGIIVIYNVFLRFRAFFGPLAMGTIRALIVLMGVVSVSPITTLSTFLDMKLWTLPATIGFYVYSLGWVARRDDPHRQSVFGEAVETTLILGIITLASVRWWWGVVPILILVVMLFSIAIRSLWKPGRDAANRFVFAGAFGLLLIDSSVVIMAGGPPMTWLGALLLLGYIPVFQSRRWHGRTQNAMPYRVTQ